MVRQRRSDSVMLHDSDQTVLCVSILMAVRRYPKAKDTRFLKVKY